MTAALVGDVLAGAVGRAITRLRDRATAAAEAYERWQVLHAPLLVTAFSTEPLPSYGPWVRVEIGPVLAAGTAGAVCGLAVAINGRGIAVHRPVDEPPLAAAPLPDADLRACATHGQGIDVIEWGPPVHGLPDTWSSIRYSCGCVLRASWAKPAEPCAVCVPSGRLPTAAELLDHPDDCPSGAGRPS